MTYGIYTISATKSVPMSVKSNETTKRPRVVPTFDMKLKMEITIFQYAAPCSLVENYDSEADK
jgi:hypothetical protein